MASILWGCHQLLELDPTVPRFTTTQTSISENPKEVGTMEKQIAAYTCQAMTNRYCDEMIVEARMLERMLNNHGIRLLNPVLSELDYIPNEHILLPNVPPDLLEKFWKADKKMIREADVVLDYMTHNKSDGSNNEIGYNRFCLWKPTVRVWNGPGALISRMEYEVIVPTLLEAVEVIHDKWGTYEKLGAWRKEMLVRSFPKWMDYQLSLLDRYGVDRELLLSLQFGFGGEKV